MTHPPLIPQPYATPAALPPQIDSHLKGLAIGNYIFGGLTLLFSCLGFIYIGIGVAALNGSFPTPPPTSGPGVQPFPNEVFGWMFVGMGSLVIVLGIAFAVLSFVAAKRLRQGRWWGYCLAIAIVQLLNFPLGTVLGVLTMVVILGDAGRARFGKLPTVRA